MSGRRFTVGEGGLRLGRSSSNDIHIADVELSRNHCLFEAFGEAGLRVTDLASANGTMVNGVTIGGDAVDLKNGDVIEVGSAILRVVGDEPPPAPPAPVATDGKVDLGFSGASAGEAKPGAAEATAVGKKKRSPLANILWGVVALVFVVLIAVVLLSDRKPAAPAVQNLAEAEAKPELKELYYEKIDADSEKVFRYSMTLSPGGTLTVALDDVPEEDRHLNKSVALSEAARVRLEEILSDPDFRTLDRDYAGPESEPPVLKSRTLKVVWSDRGKTVRCLNTVEPDIFVRVREKLEAFSKNELGIWAMGHSRSQLIALAEEAAETAEMKWEDREVEYGNLFASVHAWKEALFYLETVNPKPPKFDEWAKALKTAEAELAQRFSDHRFAADRAINIADWVTAKEELQILIALVPDRDDDRYRETAAKLMDVENRMKGGK